MYSVLLIKYKKGIMKNAGVYAPLHIGHITIIKLSINSLL